MAGPLQTTGAPAAPHRDSATSRWACRRLRFAAFVAVTAVLLVGCSGKNGVVDPGSGLLPPPLPSRVTVTGNELSWTTDTASRGSVRYGFAADALDHMAYPASKDRGDLALVQLHAVPLLDVRAGQTVFVQVVNDAPGHETGVSEVGAFVATTNAPVRLLTATMIHIGFGDSHLVSMPNGARVLIDGGERDAENAVRTYMQQHGVTSVRAMLATHVHIDHLGSFVGNPFSDEDGIFTFLNPDVFLDSPAKAPFNRSAYDPEALTTTARAAIRRSVISRGQSSENNADLAWDPDVRVLVLNSGTPPGYVSSGYEGTDINNDSIVLKFSYGDVDFIIGGDAEHAAERSMLAAFPAVDLDVEYYKAQHHGLSDANLASWVRALSPRVAFIPNTSAVWTGDFLAAIASTSENLASVGADIYAIDDAAPLGLQRGSGVQYNVTFATDGRSYEVRLEVATQTTPGKPTQMPSCMKHANEALSQTGTRETFGREP